MRGDADRETRVKPQATPPLTIRFAPGSTLVREQDRPSDLPIHRNGPPGTFVVLPGWRVSLPTDQIVFADDSAGAACVAFGGFRFDGLRDNVLTFTRVRDLEPEERLSPARSFVMRLDPAWVDWIEADGAIAWRRQ
jgi:hypothetical protein